MVCFFEKIWKVFIWNFFQIKKYQIKKRKNICKINTRKKMKSFDFLTSTNPSAPSWPSIYCFSKRIIRTLLFSWILFPILKNHIKTKAWSQFQQYTSNKKYKSCSLYVKFYIVIFYRLRNFLLSFIVWWVVKFSWQTILSFYFLLIYEIFLILNFKCWFLWYFLFLCREVVMPEHVAEPW